MSGSECQYYTNWDEIQNRQSCLKPLDTGSTDEEWEKHNFQSVRNAVKELLDVMYSNKVTGFFIHFRRAQITTFDLYIDGKYYKGSYSKETEYSFWPDKDIKIFLKNNIDEIEGFPCTDDKFNTFHFNYGGEFFYTLNVTSENDTKILFTFYPYMDQRHNFYDNYMFFVDTEATLRQKQLDSMKRADTPSDK